MKIMVTGAHGFIGKNLIATLQAMRQGNIPTPTALDPVEILPYDVDSDPHVLVEYCRQADFVCHLAGVNRPQHDTEFMEGNVGFTSTLLNTLADLGNRAPILITSSIQAELDNAYGRSKKAGEDLLRSYGLQNGVPTFIYRLPNVFGKWSRPHYNSAVATFCHNIARDLPVTVNDARTELSLVYIDDVVDEIIRAFCGEVRPDDVVIQPVHKATLGHIVDLLTAFRESRTSLGLPDLDDAFTKKLHATYLSFLPPDGFAYPLVSHRDARGSFTEAFRTPERGQFSVNIQHPGITKGEHWHHTKNEKFLVVSGEGVIRFRRINDDDVLAYDVSGRELRVVDIPPGYTHHIENTGDVDMVTLMWASECFDPTKPDTFYLKVEE